MGVLATGVPVDGTEEVVIFAESSDEDPGRRRALRVGMRQVVSATLGVTPFDVLVVDKGSLPRTSSGKPQRHEGAALYAIHRDAERHAAGRGEPL